MQIENVVLTGSWLLGCSCSVPVEANLQQYEYVHHDLHAPAGPELDGGMSHHKVACLENVATQPHHNHLDAKRNNRE